ncbi:MAG TPA: hypothetical protein VL523_13980 [Terriglobia bacterium]|nr:hypothetical protein [Terriglobia bacterium]
MLSIATLRPRWALGTVTTFCKFTAQGPFIPSASDKRTSEGTPRIVEVIGATVTDDN